MLSAVSLTLGLILLSASGFLRFCNVFCPLRWLVGLVELCYAVQTAGFWALWLSHCKATCCLEGLFPLRPLLLTVVFSSAVLVPRSLVALSFHQLVRSEVLILGFIRTCSPNIILLRSWVLHFQVEQVQDLSGKKHKFTGVRLSSRVWVCLLSAHQLTNRLTLQALAQCSFLCSREDIASEPRISMSLQRNSLQHILEHCERNL